MLADCRRCAWPWLSLHVNFGKNTAPCCPLRLPWPAFGGDIDAAWNSTAAIQLREAIVKDSVPCRAFCYPLIPGTLNPRLMPWSRALRRWETNEFPRLGYGRGPSSAFLAHAARVQEEIRLGQTRLSVHPIQLRINGALGCNLNCIMCNQAKQRNMGRVQMAHPAIWDWAYEHHQELMIVIVGGGEAWHNPNSKKFLEECAAHHYDFGVGFVSNGSLLDFALMQELNLRQCTISVDGFDPRLCEFIRRGLDAYKLIGDLCHWRSLHREGKLRGMFLVAYAIQKANIHDVPNAVRICKSFDFPIRFSLADSNIPKSPHAIWADDVYAAARAALEEAIAFSPDPQGSGLRDILSCVVRLNQSLSLTREKSTETELQCNAQD